VADSAAYGSSSIKIRSAPADGRFSTQEYGMAVAPGEFMAKPAKKNSNGAPQNSGDTTAAMIDRDRLAQRAYELYLARGGQDGADLDDWLTAEQELRGGGATANRDERASNRDERAPNRDERAPNREEPTPASQQ
jgi:hypothetical protein